MTVDIKKNGARLDVAIGGRLDTLTSPELHQALSQQSLNDVTEIVMDLGELEYISSAGLRVLLLAQKKMDKQGSMKALHVNEAVMEVFVAMGFADILTIE